MEKILKKLGFTHMTATLWRHQKVGIISITEKDSIEDIVDQIYRRGYAECQEVIKADLGIKS